MTAIIITAILFWLFYYFFIKGTIYPILFLIFGIYGGKLIILDIFPISEKIILTFATYNISYATFAATLISILAIGFLMEKIGD